MTEDRKIKLTDISVLSAHDVDTNSLLDFYKTQYPERAISYIWRWLNRCSFYDNKIPLILLYNDRVIAHAGMIPFNVFLDKRYYRASWFIDFAVLPEFQRQGLGAILTKRWMEFSDLYITFCNEKSMGLFKKYGWVESFDTYLHRYLLNPFEHLIITRSISPFLCKGLNRISRLFYKIIYQKYASSADSLHFDILNPDSADKFMASLDMPDNTVMPVRDTDYISWRLLNSPDIGKYRVVSVEGINDTSIIIKFWNDRYGKYIDILWACGSFNYFAIRRIIADLAMWGISKGYSYIRYYTSSKELSSFLSKSLKPAVEHPRFAFYTKDTSLLKKLEHANWHWELIDSDFERL